MKSTMTREEHNAAALLLGRFYDWRDHTYCSPNLEDVLLDADKCEPLPWRDIYQRKKMVEQQELGCADGPFSLSTTEP